MIFPALIHKDPTSDYGLSFPDLPGCCACEKSLDKLFRSAQDVLIFHLDGMKEENLEIPTPCSLVNAAELLSTADNGLAVILVNSVL